MSDIVYKLKHIPSGLYYQPVKGRWKSNKTNLAVRGKVYTSKTYPKMDKPEYIYSSEFLTKKYNIRFRETNYGYLVDTIPSDWELETFELKKLNI